MKKLKQNEIEVVGGGECLCVCLDNFSPGNVRDWNACEWWCTSGYNHGGVGSCN